MILIKQARSHHSCSKSPKALRPPASLSSYNPTPLSDQIYNHTPCLAHSGILAGPRTSQASSTFVFFLQYANTFTSFKSVHMSPLTEAYPDNFIKTSDWATQQAYIFILQYFGYHLSYPSFPCLMSVSCLSLCKAYKDRGSGVLLAGCPGHLE